MKVQKWVRRTCWLASYCLLATGFALAQQTESPTGQQILDQTLTTYAQCESYMDTGNVKTVFINPNGKRTVVKPFSTAFVRPAAFRFEFQERKGEEEWTRYIVWQDGNALKSYWTLNQTEKEFADLGQALAGPTGVSSGSATNIPALLVPASVRGGILRNLKNIKLVGEETLDNFAAYKLEGFTPRGDMLTVWIDKKRSVILKLYAVANLESKDRVSGAVQPFTTETTTTYYPAINVPIPPGRLKYGKDLPKADGQ